MLQGNSLLTVVVSGLLQRSSLLSGRWWNVEQQ
jgi:hypothetical protein